ncbi:unnamed protein product, partial [marine sediment metagenome]
MPYDNPEDKQPTNGNQTHWKEVLLFTVACAVAVVAMLLLIAPWRRADDTTPPVQQTTPKSLKPIQSPEEQAPEPQEQIVKEPSIVVRLLRDLSGVGEDEKISDEEAVETITQILTQALAD